MIPTDRLFPARDLVADNPARFPNESTEYRRARNKLLIEEIELRRHVERVAALRRQLPPGGEVAREYRFIGEQGPATLADLFGDKETLIVYSWMYGPERTRPCPMCTSLLNALDAKIHNFEERVSLVVTARSPIERLVTVKQALGWRQHRLYSDGDGSFTREYVHPDDEDVPGYTVFTRRDGTIRHFWSGEMTDEMADPGQDPRGAPDFDPLWTLLDTTPEGRGTDWYPGLALNV